MILEARETKLFGGVSRDFVEANDIMFRRGIFLQISVFEKSLEQTQACLWAQRCHDKRSQRKLCAKTCAPKNLRINICTLNICAKNCAKISGKICALSGPVLRDAARLSQRYPPIARYGVFGVSTWPIGCDTPSSFSERLLLGEHAKWRCDTPPQKGYLSDTCAIPYENKANGCDAPICDTISKGYCPIWGGISHWAAKSAHQTFLRTKHLRKTKSVSKSICA